MKQFILSFFLVLTVISSSFAAHRMVDLETNKDISLEEFSATLTGRENIILGEYHYNLPIQTGEGLIIRSVVKNLNLDGRFTVAWEFLNYVDQPLISASFNEYRKGELDGDQLMMKLFPGSNDPEHNRPYLQVMEATRDLDGELIGSNALRSVKTEIRKKGIDGVDPDLIPPMMELGSADYRERFSAAMGGHVPPEKVESYFVAQSYTDSVMAYQVGQLASQELRFLVVGAFHSDYRDGVVKQFTRYSDKESVTIKIVNASQVEEEELERLLNPHPKYGQVADYLFLIE